MELAIAAAAAVAAVAVFLVLRGRKPQPGAAPAADPEVDRFVRRGDYAQAAAAARRLGRDEEALEYYLRAQQPENAAQLAVKLGNVRRAGELYERAGNWERAAHYYEKASMPDQASDMRKKLPGRAIEIGAAAAEPQTRARQLEQRFREKLATIGASEADRAQIQRLARDAADALLNEGDIKRAADVYRDADLDDEAIHIYVNVLGSPGEAAPILASRGNHERAAELYELAGQRERAAAAWVEVARVAKRVEGYLDRIEQLSDRIFHKFLESETVARPLSQESAELHYRLATTLEREGKTERAAEVLVRIQTAIGPYKDVAQRLAGIRAGKPNQVVAVPARDTSRDSGPRPVQPAPPGASPLSQAELQQIAMQVARAAAEQLARTDAMSQIMASAATTAQRGTTTIQVVRAVGIEQSPIELELAFDSAIAAARVGPSINTLRQVISGRPCELQNIEVYYRLGLAHQAAGDWPNALDCYEAVEEASPGYRDADKRAEEIRRWQDAVGSRVTGLGTARQPGAAPGEGGRYKILGELGRGGMAVVYRAQDSRLGRPVALKFLSEEFSSHPDMRDLFQREARSVAALNHPNIVTIHDFGILEGRAFICMELVEGKAVEQLIHGDRGLTIVEALRIIRQALDALAYAHDRKIVHRDIKPANIMRTAAGLTKLMDFGLAKSIEGKQKTSFVAGTPAYMPPEQVAGRDVDHRADIFAIGVTLYEMLTIKHPYEGLDRSRPPIAISDHVPAIPSILEDAVMKAIALDPTRRFQHATEMMGPIDHILEAVNRYAGAGTPAAAADPRPEPVTQRETPSQVGSLPTVAFKKTTRLD